MLFKQNSNYCLKIFQFRSRQVSKKGKISKMHMIKLQYTMQRSCKRLVLL